MAAAGALVAQALRAALTLTPGEGIAGADAEHALSVMNGLLAAWGADAFSRPTATLEPLALSPNQASYTVGAGGQMNTPRPDAVQTAFFRDGPLDRPLRLLTREEYLAVPVKSQGGDPDSLYYDPTFPLGTLTLWPVPTRALTLWLDSLKPLPQFTSVSTVLTLPGEYEEALKYLTAERLCVDYGLPVSPDLRALAVESKRRLTRKNARVKLTSDPHLRRPVLDIRTGTSY